MIKSPLRRVLKTAAEILLAVVIILPICSCLEWQDDDQYLQMLNDLLPMQPNEVFTFDSDEANNHIVGLNAPLYLDSDEDLSEGLDHSANFGWTGCMRVTLVQVTVYDTMDEAGIDSSNHFYRDMNQMFRGNNVKLVL